MTYVILSARDRYARENNKMLAGPTEHFVAETIGWGTKFEVTDDLKFWPPPLSKVILCGGPAARAWLGPQTELEKVRGYVHAARMCEVVATFLPIDCTDIVNHEPEGFGGHDEDETTEEKGNSKDAAPTSRQNYRYWFGADVAKLLCGERRSTWSNKDCVHTCYDPVGELRRCGDILFFDIETHPPTNTVQCFSFAGRVGPIHIVPCYDHRGQTRCSIVEVFRELVRAMQRCVVVGHNISFDLGFLAHTHGVPWGPRLEDTMIQHHRVFPESEKDLGHVISYWINSPYHKDSSGTFNPYNERQYQQLLAYCAADVAATRAVYYAQRAYCDSRPGLAASFASANRSIEVYLRAGLTGFEFNSGARLAEQKALGDRIKSATRIFHRLVGYDLLPTSPKQLGEYLYGKMRYPVVETTDTGAPSTGAGALYDLALKYPKNTALQVLLTLRDLNKQVDMLGFEPYYRLDKR